MITTPTVFVLGAGASMPYGFPSGPELREIILHGTAQPGPGHASRRNWKHLTQELGFSFEQVRDFHQAFKLSQTRSIDVFLSRRPEFAGLGKAAIASALLPLEQSHRLFDPVNDGPDLRWYYYLLDLLDGPPSDFAGNRVHILTFNYDRSLEYYLFTALKHRHGCSDEVCADMLEELNIIHVHGTLGDLLWQADARAAHDYGREVAADQIRAAAQRIRIVFDEPQEADRSREIGDVLAAAKQLIFLGFSYDRMNLDHIGYRRVTERRTGGTSLGLKSGEVTHIVSHMAIDPRTLQAMDCLEYLRFTRHLLV